MVDEFEQLVCQKLGVKLAVAVNSCTAAIELVLSLFEIKDCEVLVPTYTFVSTVNSIVHLGGFPRLIDSDPSSYNISVEELARVIEEDYYQHEKELINKQTQRKLKGIIVVHFAGNPAEIEKINALAVRYNLFVLEDAAHAFGASRCG